MKYIRIAMKNKLLRTGLLRLYHLGGNFIEVILILSLYIIKPLKHIKICPIRDERIGHLAADTDVFLRRLQLGIINNEGVTFVGLASTKPVNKQLLKMLQRKLFILQLPTPKRYIHIIRSMFWGIFNERTLFGKSAFYQPIYHKTNEYYEFTNAKPNINFTENEEKKGKELLNEMGVSDNSWFICFHARDNAYLSCKVDGGHDWSYHDYRDSNIKDSIKAAEYIASQGGFAIRMGHIVAEKLPDLQNPRIVDYASNFRTDFGDIYLPAKCKFFIGVGCGIDQVAQIFNVPIIWVNRLPVGIPPWRKGDLFIPKKLWLIEKKRFLTFHEILNSDIGLFTYSEQYEKAGLKIIENTAQEILDLAMEMNERLDGTFEYTKEDEELQNKYHSLIKPHHFCYGTPARIGAKFLRENMELLES